MILNLDDIESLTHGRKWASRSIRIAGPRTRKAAAPVAPEFPGLPTRSGWLLRTGGTVAYQPWKTKRCFYAED